MVDKSNFIREEKVGTKMAKKTDKKKEVKVKKKDMNFQSVDSLSMW